MNKYAEFTMAGELLTHCMAPNMYLAAVNLWGGGHGHLLTAERSKCLLSPCGKYLLVSCESTTYKMLKSLDINNKAPIVKVRQHQKERENPMETVFDGIGVVEGYKDTDTVKEVLRPFGELWAAKFQRERPECKASAIKFINSIFRTQCVMVLLDDRGFVLHRRHFRDMREMLVFAEGFKYATVRTL